METFYLYILCCRFGQYYTGFTSDIEKRLAEHASGLSFYTKNKRPFTLVFLQSFMCKHDAFCAEQKIKGWTRQKKEALIAGEWNKLSSLSKKVFK
ncbi:MAG: tRNA/rRNA methyltransferase (SpoU) [candidate division TM6 bacterium GW2011_GWF2_32_72]|nr:MAG: tRNA/rRNA methyltransferase (SpoU) [candidate division TM6 bacterium GW2011_GWF2_32_72]